MNKLSQWIEEKMLPIVSKFAANRYVSALKRGFMIVMPLTIIGSIFMLITDFPWSSWGTIMTSLMGENWDSYFAGAYRATFNILGLVFCGTMGYSLAQEYKLDDVQGLVFSIVAYVVVAPKTVTTASGEIVNKVLSFTWLGTQGIITAMIVSVLTIEIMRFVVKKNLVITMPDSVPPMVARSFSALIPGIIVVSVMLLINGISVNIAGSFPELIYRIIQVPMQNLSSNLVSICLVSGLSGTLWWLGIHPSVITAITNPLLTANADANAAIAAAGKLTLQNGSIGTLQVYDQFATLGGSGMTLGLIIAMLLVARSNRLKSMTKLASVPAFFNINEPLVFGLPMVLNPLMLIPLTLAPIAAVLVVYISMQIGFLPLFTNHLAPWATPVVISGFIVGGWQGAIVQIIATAASTAIYYPFVKILDKKYREEENA